MLTLQCNLQENTEEALEQIANMDRVYGSALVTFVAAEGADAHAGLRGVRREQVLVADRSEGIPRRVSQPSAENLVSASSHPLLASKI